MTSATMGEVEKLLNYLNSYFGPDSVNYALESTVTTHGGSPLGRIVWNTDEEEYVYIPGPGYQAYVPQVGVPE